ncbi:hypothetical protein LJB99_01765 [Deltaproteobacteria bacterium OttesenSCG-928-K17]|nr:hypothetical protein [Deltaproteobacteria bacterium OttesenSCG-928-K17]
MKTFRELNHRLSNLLSGLDGDLWREMMAGVNPPKKLPEEQGALDMVFRDAKAFSGYIPDMMALMRKNLPGELPPEELMALRGLMGYAQLFTRMLLMILLVPRYNDHEDLITTFNGYRQTLVFVEDYLAQAEGK